jgi:transcriptional regulator GlxA family with amidase domain
MHRQVTISHRTGLLEEASAIVQAEFARDLSLTEIARRVASSRRQLQRAYAEIGRTTFREQLTAVRMQRAADMLRDRVLTIRDIARQVGYRQPAQFAKAFRRHFGVSPSEYRRRRVAGERRLSHAA